MIGFIRGIAALTLVLACLACDDDAGPNAGQPDPDTSSDAAVPDVEDTVEIGDTPGDGDSSEVSDSPVEQPQPEACEPQATPSLESLAEGSWDDAFLLPGVNGEAPGLRALALGADGAVYVGGLFEVAGLESATNVARWTQEEGWTALGDGIDGFVIALTVSPDGDLLASSAHWNEDFTENWGQLDVWEGESWSELARIELPPDTFEPDRVGVQRMTHDAAGRLVLAGNFTGVGESDVANLAVLDGESWVGLGAPDGPVLGLTVSDNALCAGGGFSHIGGVEANRVACWDGDEWMAHDLPVDGTVWSLAREPGGALLAGGFFDLSDPSTYDGGSVARWDGDGWELLGRGVGIYSALEMRNTPGLVRDIAVIGDQLFVAGSFSNASGTSPDGVPNVDVSNIASLELPTTSWDPLDGGTTRAVGFAFDFDDVFAIANDGEALYAVGIFSGAGERSAFNVARWDDGAFTPLTTPGEPDSGVHGWVRSLAQAGDCGLYLGGAFDRIGRVAARNVARYDDGAFQRLGEGLPLPVDDLAIDGATGDVLAVGWDCSDLERGCSSTVSRFDGTAWEAVGEPIGGVMTQLAMADGIIYAGGNWLLEGETLGHVLAFDGAGWLPVGGGVSDIVSALHVDPAGDLIVGGNFERAGDVDALHVARWDGEGWHALGNGITGQVLSLTTYRQRLVVGSQVQARGEGMLVAELDGESWQEIGTGLLSAEGSSEQVMDLVADGDVLYVTGQLNFFGGTAAYDGERWTVLGQMNLFGDSIAIAPDGLYVGGGFALVEGLPSVGLARLAP